MVLSNTLALKPIETHDRAADFLKKPLPREQHETCCKLVELYATHEVKAEDKIEEEDEEKAQDPRD